VIKHGKHLTRLEGENLLFLKSCVPNIPAPRLHAMWRGGGDKPDLYIVMDMMPVKALSELWPIMENSNKTRVLNELGDIFKSLHGLQPPELALGDNHGGPPPFHLFYDTDGGSSIMGPSKTGREMILGLAKKSRANANSALNKGNPYLADFYERHLARELDDHSPTFCHSDVQPKNIVVDMTQDDQTQSKVFRVSIID
jgi:aminoglycoside phosphotransferase (APT) family kinase protein